MIKKKKIKQIYDTEKKKGFKTGWQKVHALGCTIQIIMSGSIILWFDE